MKQFWNWKTALTGVLTALLLAVAVTVAFFAYSHYVGKPSLQGYSVELKEGEDATITVNVDGQDGKTYRSYTPSIEEIKKLFGYHYVLYKELCDNRLVRKGGEPYLQYRDLLFSDSQDLEFPSAFSEEEQKTIQGIYDEYVEQVRSQVEEQLQEIEGRFAEFNSQYDYWIVDRQNPKYILTNAENADLSQFPSENYAFIYEVDYDEYGVPSIPEKPLMTGSPEALRKNVNTVLHEKNNKILDIHVSGLDMGYAFLRTAAEKATRIKNPTDCRIIIGITWEKYELTPAYVFNEEKDEWFLASQMFDRAPVHIFMGGTLFLAVIMGYFWLNPRSEEKRKNRILIKAPLELVVALALLVFSGEEVLLRWATSMYLGYRADYVFAFLFAFFICMISWYVGGCLGEFRILGIGNYVRKRGMFLRGFGALRRHVKKVWLEYHELNLGMNLRRKILRLVIYNAILVSVFCCAWFLGILGVIFYSICLFFLIMQYITAVQKDYAKLQRMTMQMSEGNLKYEPEGNLGLFEPVKEDLVQIRNGFDKAVQEEVKSHKMKTELITNVSHDLKTPLTAIITYVNLLKEKNLTPEQREQYVDTLDKKSLRLKRLIEDLFEVSKANSGNVQLNLQNCDLVNLIKQCFYEVEDRFEEKKLTTRISMPEEKVILRLDSEKTYRIYENLFNNILKYAMPGTRVYITMTESDGWVTVAVKNITEAELYVPAQELTERFVRGDASRGSVEGSGLGLAIVRSFTELQGGKLDIDVDGDLFKVTTQWRKE